MRTHIVSFSGGQTSGYMLRKLMDSEPDFAGKFQVLFCNTGKEHDRTLDFVHDVETKWGVPVTWLEYCRIPAVDIDPVQVMAGRRRTNLAKQVERGETAHWFRVVRWETAARRFDSRTPFDEMLGWAGAAPNVRTRQCSVQLKLRTQFRFLNSIGVFEHVNYIGIRADEAHRKLEILANIDRQEKPEFPLCDDGTTVADVDAFWLAHPFRLNIPNHMGNCDLCFLKARWKRLAAARREPEAAQWWADKEAEFAARGVTADGAVFRKGQPYAALIAEATHPELNLGDESEEDVACSCNTGGHRAHAEIATEDWLTGALDE